MAKVWNQEYFSEFYLSARLNSYLQFSHPVPILEMFKNFTFFFVQIVSGYWNSILQPLKFNQFLQWNNSESSPSDDYLEFTPVEICKL